MMSTLFLDDTEWEILFYISICLHFSIISGLNPLCCVSLIVHEEEVDVIGIVDNEGFVA